jgi:hypothetical protein
MLTELKEALQEGRAVNQRYEGSFVHLKRIFENATSDPDYSGRREGIVKWYGPDEAASLIASFHAFLQSYWNRGIASKGFLPFSEFFDLMEVPRDEVVKIVDRLLETINTTYQGFVLWPPPRQGPCF